MKRGRKYFGIGHFLRVGAAVCLLALHPAWLSATPADPLREGVQAFYQGNLDRAVSLARVYLKLHPNDPAGLVLLARAEMAQGRAEPAYQALREALRADPKNIDALYYLGEVSKTLGQIGYQQLMEMAPDGARAHQFLAESYVAQHRDDKAADEYKEALKSDPRSVELLCALGDVERWLRRFDDAIGHYSQALELEPHEFCGYFGVGVSHLRRHELPDATRYLRRAAELEPQSGETRLALGSVLLSSGDASGALLELKAAVAYKPDMRQAYALLAHAYRLLGQTPEAEAALAKAKELEQREHEYVNRALIEDDLSLAPQPERQ
jgi:tetratricopeptide (TPR) repeat protein